MIKRRTEKMSIKKMMQWLRNRFGNKYVDLTSRWAF
jgi:hypothetical protein